ncbi:hypothetical protein CFOL_v3_10930 [Cephalotus follicularis]|uniref:Uncharacterized protein n=1 Tax=Cephalotus follicularis TaxID=3775 RepID=A0A1Q3BHS2_CEPFO|nr:hypothetical protein CFOL_v3_10930 [Cephalotus follicularis]
MWIYCNCGISICIGDDPQIEKTSLSAALMNSYRFLLVCFQFLWKYVCHGCGMISPALHSIMFFTLLGQFHLEKVINQQVFSTHSFALSLFVDYLLQGCNHC